MQFHNTSDTATRTVTDKQDCSGELHAKLLEETKPGGNCTTWGSDTPTTHRQRASCRANPRAATGAQATDMPQHPRITTTRQNSHVIRLREHSTTSRNVAIPTTTIQCLKQSRGNYVRNWWALGNRSGTEVFPQRRLLTTLRTTDPSRKPPTHALSCTDDEAPATRSSPHSSHEPLQMQIRRGADLAVGPSAYPINTVQVVPVSSSKCLSSALREPVWPVPYSLVMTPTVGGQPCDNGKGS